MPKALCLTGLVVAGLVFLLFFSDLLFGLIGYSNLAIFGLVSLWMDIWFLVASLGLGFLAWNAFREQK